MSFRRPPTERHLLIVTEQKARAGVRAERAPERPLRWFSS